MAVGSFPVDGIYAQQQAEAERLYQQSLTNIAASKQSILQQYGYTPDYKLDGGNPYGGMQQIEHNYETQVSNVNRQLAGLSNARSGFGRDYGIDIGGGTSYTIDPNADGVFQRLGKSHDTLNSRLADLRAQSQTDTGLQSQSFDSDMNPTGDLLLGSNRHGSYQKLLLGQAGTLQADQENALGRGLGTTGLGAKAASNDAFVQEGDRQSLKTSLINDLKNNAHNYQDERTAYGQRTTDTDRAIQDALFGFNQEQDTLNSDLKELSYQKGLQENNSQLALQQALAAQNAAALAAQQQHNDTSGGLTLEQILAAIRDQNFNPAAQTAYALPNSVATQPNGRKLYISSPGGRGGF